MVIVSNLVSDSDESLIVFDFLFVVSSPMSHECLGIFDFSNKSSFYDSGVCFFPQCFDILLLCIVFTGL